MMNRAVLQFAAILAVLTLPASAQAPPYTPTLLPTSAVLPAATAATTECPAVVAARVEQSCRAHRSLSRSAIEPGSRGQHVSGRDHAGTAVDAEQSESARPRPGGSCQATELGPQRASAGRIPGCHEHADAGYSMDHRSRQCVPLEPTRRNGCHPAATRFRSRQRTFDEHAAAARHLPNRRAARMRS